MSQHEIKREPKMSALTQALYCNTGDLFTNEMRLTPETWLVEEPDVVIFFCEGEPVRAEIVLSLRYHDWCELEQSEAWKGLVDYLKANKERRNRQQQAAEQC